VTFSQEASVQVTTESAWLINAVLNGARGTGMAGPSSHTLRAPSALRPTRDTLWDRASDGASQQSSHPCSTRRSPAVTDLIP